MASAYKAENMLLQRAAKDVKSTTLQRHTGTFQAFLYIHWGTAALYGQSLSAVDTKGTAIHTHTDTNFLFFSHERTSCRKESWVISCVSKGQSIIFSTGISISLFLISPPSLPTLKTIPFLQFYSHKFLFLFTPLEVSWGHRRLLLLFLKQHPVSSKY